MYLFKTPPPDFHHSVEVAGCYCEWEDKFLFLQRHRNKPIGGKWGIPAGKLEKGETAIAAVIRETFEEAGLLLLPENLISCGKGYVKIPEGQFIFHFFRYQFTTKPHVTINSEHEDFRWVSRIEANELDLIRGADEFFTFIFG